MSLQSNSQDGQVDGPMTISQLIEYNGAIVEGRDLEIEPACGLYSWMSQLQDQVPGNALNCNASPPPRN